MDSKKRNVLKLVSISQSSRLSSLSLWRGSDWSLARSAPVLRAGVEAEGRSVGLLALTGQAGPTSGMLPGNDVIVDGLSGSLLFRQSLQDDCQAVVAGVAGR